MHDEKKETDRYSDIALTTLECRELLRQVSAPAYKPNDRHVLNSARRKLERGAATELPAETGERHRGFELV